MFNRVASFYSQMSRSFTRDVFRYTHLAPSGGRASRLTTWTSLPLCHVLTVMMTLLFVAMAGFFAGRISLANPNKHVIQCEFTGFLDSHQSPYSDARDNSDNKS